MTRNNLSKDERVRDLTTGLQIAFVIDCASCGNGEQSSETIALAAAKEFDDLGWRVIDNEHQCTECVVSDTK